MLLVAVLDVLVDPYGYFGSPRIAGFNAVKPAAANRVRAVKPRAVIRAHPHTVIVGNSRPEMGLDPQSPYWPAGMRPVYNLAIPGDSVEAQAEYATEALESTDATTLVWAIDFLDFLDATPSRVQASRTSSTAAMTGIEAHLDEVRTTLLAMLSTQTLTDSIWTVMMQSDADSATRTELGFNPARDYLPIIATQGAYILFQQKRDTLNGQLTHSRISAFGHGSEESAEFAAFDGVLRLCVAKNIRLIVLINPYHSEYLHIIGQHGYAQMQQEWKAAVRERVAADPHAELWDFSDPSPYLQEPPPRAQSRQPLRWFWEPSHYRRELGELMLARMLQPAAYEGVQQFGRRLAP